MHTHCPHYGRRTTCSREWPGAGRGHCAVRSRPCTTSFISNLLRQGGHTSTRNTTPSNGETLCLFCFISYTLRFSNWQFVNINFNVKIQVETVFLQDGELKCQNWTCEGPHLPHQPFLPLRPSGAASASQWRGLGSPATVFPTHPANFQTRTC